MNRQQFHVLYREFLFRMVDLELLSADAKGDSAPASSVTLAKRNAGRFSRQRATISASPEATAGASTSNGVGSSARFTKMKPSHSARAAAWSG